MPVATSPEVLRFMAYRRSASALTLIEPGPSADQLADLIRLATRVPDHGKLAPWRFIVLDGSGKTAFCERLDALCHERREPLRASKLAKLKAPPLAIAVISAPKASAIPDWEQTLSAGAVCLSLVNGALAMGFGANWITDWYSYDATATQILGVAGSERVAGFILIGSPRDPPQERERPDLDPLVTRWA